MAETGKARSFQDILQQNQEFIAHLQALQEDVSRQLAEKQKELDELQNAQLQWAVDRESLVKGRDAAVTKQARREQEGQQARVQLTEERNRLTAQIAQLQTQLKAAQGEVVPLKQERDHYQAERQRLVNDIARLEQEGQTRDSQYRADRKLLNGDLEEARKKIAALEKAQADAQRIADERTALAAKVRALEKDWQTRETSFAEEKAALKQQAQDAGAKLSALQQDYDKMKALHQDLAGEAGRKTADWTNREQRLTSEKNQLKVDLERVQQELSEMMSRSNDLQTKRTGEWKELELAWQREKAALKAQLEEARKAAGSAPLQPQVIQRFEAEKRALQAQVEGLRNELAVAGKG